MGHQAVLDAIRRRDPAAARQRRGVAHLRQVLDAITDDAGDDGPSAKRRDAETAPAGL